MTASNRMGSFLATMRWEGGASISMDEYDAGNWSGGKVGIGHLAGSKYGVSAMTAARMELVVADITADQALKIFVDGYWTPCACDDLATGLDHCVSDEAYNAGPGSARKLYARGGFTPQSDPATAIKDFSALRLAFLQSLKSWGRYGAGWARRVGGVEAESLRMAMSAAAVPPAEQDAKIKTHADDVKNTAVKHATAGAGAGAAAPTIHVAAHAANHSAFQHFAIEAMVVVIGIAAIIFVVNTIMQSQRAAGLSAPPPTPEPPK